MTMDMKMVESLIQIRHKRTDYFSGLVYFIFLFWVLTKKGAREMKCKHNGCGKERFWRLWAVGYCYDHAFKYARKAQEK